MFKSFCLAPFSNYVVNEEGKVKNIKTSRFISTWISEGYAHVNLRAFINGKSIQKTFKVHRAVAIAFIKNPNLLKITHHKDSNRQNNNVSNLEWVTSKQNSLYAGIKMARCQIKKMKPCKVTDTFLLFSKKFNNLTKAAKFMKVSKNGLNKYLNKNKFIFKKFLIFE